MSPHPFIVDLLVTGAIRVFLLLSSLTFGCLIRPGVAVSSCLSIFDTATGTTTQLQVLIQREGTASEPPEDFWIDAHEVTNAQFREFVEATGYVTSAERHPDPAKYPQIPASLLVPGSASFIKLEDRPKGQWREWWKFIEGASWRKPTGPNSSIDGMDSHPVIHVSHVDALAYATWAGRSLPTEAQWEYAAQASAEFSQANAWHANTWQGFFPLQDKALDGFDGVAPVGCYSADASGLFDMKGNVWEMVTDVFDSTPESLTSVAPMRVIKGGSYLCADNFCLGDSPQSRQGQEEDFSSDHVGFRTVSLINNSHKSVE